MIDGAKLRDELLRLAHSSDHFQPNEAEHGFGWKTPWVVCGYTRGNGSTVITCKAVTLRGIGAPRHFATYRFDGDELRALEFVTEFETKAAQRRMIL